MDDRFKNIQAFTGSSLIAERPAHIQHPDCYKFMLTDLAASGLLPDDLGAYPTAPAGTLLQYVIPYPQDGMYRCKTSDPKNKYIGPRNRNEVWWSSKQDYHTFRSAPVLLIVEGEKKAAKAIKQWGLPTLGIGGIWNGMRKLDDGNFRLHEALDSAIGPGQRVIFIFDDGVLNSQRNPGSRQNNEQALHLYYQMCERLGAKPTLYICPPGGETKGLDDLLVSLERRNIKIGTFEEVGLVLVPFETLTPTRREFVKRLGLDTNEDGGIIQNGSNCKTIFEDWFPKHFRYDRRLGFLDLEYKPVERMIAESAFISYWESTLRLKWIPFHINYAMWSVRAQPGSDLLAAEFKSVAWDGVPRLDSWGSDYLPHKDGFDKYSDEWGRLLITALTFRVLHPGIKFDNVMMLVGPQGIRKTTFFEELGKFKCGGYYATIDSLKGDDSSSRTLGARIRRNIVLDFSEGAVLDGRQAKIEVLKSFVTQQTDRFREVYARDETVLPRSFILVGTSNRRNQLFDQSGSRRWAILDVDGLIKLLDYDFKMQLVAEVIAKQDEILKSDWWDFKITWDDMPEQMQQNLIEVGFTPNEHLSEGFQVLEGLNSEHIRENASVTEFKMLLEDPEQHFATHRSHPNRFVTCPAHVMSKLNITKVEASFVLDRVSEMINYKYKIGYGTPKIIDPQALICPQGVTPFDYSHTPGAATIRPVWIDLRT